MSCCSCSWVLEDIKNVTGTSAVIFYNTSAPHAVPAFLNLCLGRMETLQVFSAFEMRCFVIKAFKRSPAVATWLKLKWMKWLKCLICRTSRVTLSLVPSVLRCADTSMYLPNLHVSSSILYYTFIIFYAMSVYCILCFIVYSIWRFGILMIFFRLSSKFFASRRSKGSIKVTSHPVTRSRRRVRPEGSPKGPRRVPEGSPKGPRRVPGVLTLAVYLHVYSTCRRSTTTSKHTGPTRTDPPGSKSWTRWSVQSWANDQNHEISITFINFHPRFSSSNVQCHRVLTDASWLRCRRRLDLNVRHFTASQIRSFKADANETQMIVWYVDILMIVWWLFVSPDFIQDK